MPLRTRPNRPIARLVPTLFRATCLLLPTLAVARPAPVVPLEELDKPEYSQRMVTTAGTVVETFRDEIDTSCEFLILKSEGAFLPVAYTRDPGVDPARWLDAEVSVTGMFFYEANGSRRFSAPTLTICSHLDSAIRIMTPPPDDPFACESLDQCHWISPRDVVRLGRRAASGTVLARWDANRFALRTRDGDTIVVRLRSGEPPSPGRCVRVVGYPETDLYRLNLTRAVCREEPALAAPPEAPPVRIPAKALFRDERGLSPSQGPVFNYTDFNGRPVTLAGTIRSRALRADSLHLELDCGGRTVGVDVDRLASPALADLEPFSEIEATGVCLMECENWNPELIWPHITGCRVFVRRPDDIRILARPPWWTPARLVLAIAILLAVALGFAVWSAILRKIVARRSRELLDEQVARLGADVRTSERTRLAIELHDALSQNLEGVAFQVAAAKDLMKISTPAAEHTLDAAVRMLLSSRTELRRCLFDLRHDALAAASFDKALRTTLGPISGDAELTVRFNVPRDIFTETSAHIVLSVIRELVSNAVRHGRARHVRIAGEYHGGNLSFSVRDDGAGFDANRHPGPAEGHFGLEGIRERVRRLGGVFRIESVPGGPTRAVVTAELEPPKGETRT